MKNKTKRLTLAGILVASTLFGGVESVSASTLYRAYNGNTGEHLYTQNKNEIPFVVKNGWRNEGTAWEAPNEGTAVYRLFNPNNGGDHFYTLNTNERDHLKKVGWRYEGVSWHSQGSVPVYRLYNPNAKSGTHHYTVSIGERDALKRAGWRDEGVAFQASREKENNSVPKPAVKPAIDPATDTTPHHVDVDLTGVGGHEEKNHGSYRMLYSNRPFDVMQLSDTPTVEFTADVALKGASNDYETQFVIAGNGPHNGQIGISLHYQGGPYVQFGQNRINTTSINFPAGSGITGQQYYSVNTKTPPIENGATTHLQVKYFDEKGYMQAYVNGQMIGQYQTKLIPDRKAYILHDTSTNGQTTLQNVCVLMNGIDVTRGGLPSFPANTFTVSNDSVSAAYFE